MIKQFLISSLIVVVSIIMLAAPVSAFDLFQETDCGGKTADSAVCNSQVGVDENPIFGPNGILLKITYIVAFVAGAAATILIIIGSLRYITSGGDPQKASSAKSTVMNSLIGLVIIVMATTIISFVVSKL